MVRRIVSFFSQRITGMHAAAYVIALFAFVSQFLGLIRDRMLAHLFGAGTALDVYYAAFRIPDFIFASLASIVSLFVLIPILSDKLAREGKDPARHFLSEITTFFCIFIVAVSAIVWFLAPALGARLYPGFGPVEQAAFIQLTRILLLSPILLGISNILSGVTQLAGRFVIYALSPILYNLGIIAGIFLFFPSLGLAGIGWGVVLGAVLHVLIQVPTVIKERLMPRITFSYDWRALWSVVATSLPRTTTLALNQLVLLVLVGLASRLAAGSVTVFTFASNLYMAPLTLIGVSYSVAAFPTLSRLFSAGDRDAFFIQLTTALRHIIFWSVPALVLFIVLRAHIVRTLLGSGAFDWTDTRLTAAALALFLLSLPLHGLVLLFVRAYYATGKTARPLLVTVTSSIITVLVAIATFSLFTTMPFLRYFIESLLRINDVPGTSVVMIALSYSIGLLVNATAFWFLFRRDFGGHIPRNVMATLGESIASSVIAGGAAYLVIRLTEGFFDLSIALHVFLQGAIAGIVGVFLWVVLLKVLKNQELEDLLTTLHARFWASAPIAAPEPEEI